MIQRNCVCGATDYLQDNLASKVRELELKVAEIQKKQQLMDIFLQNPVIVQSLQIAEVKKLEFKLDSIDIKELSGMLNIGINKRSRYKKKDIKK